MPVIRLLQMQRHLFARRAAVHNDEPLAFSVLPNKETYWIVMKVFKAVWAFHGRIVAGAREDDIMAHRVGDYTQNPGNERNRDLSPVDRLRGFPQYLTHMCSNAIAARHLFTSCAISVTMPCNADHV